jgi:putative membrane protein
MFPKRQLHVTRVAQTPRNLEGEVTITPSTSASNVLEAYRTPRQLDDFTFKRWDEHRSTSRYNRHIASLFNSSVFQQLTQSLLTVGAIATGVCAYESDVVPVYDLAPSLLMPTAPFDLTSFALALLLVFRTNSSYDRFVEVTGVWSGLGNRARDTMRQCISHIQQDGDELHPLAGAMCRWTVAYVRALKCDVVQDSDLRKELKQVLTDEEAEAMMNSRHRPAFAVSILTELGAAAPLNESHRIRLDENLTYFEDAVGSCERILMQPIPLAYSRHTSRFMVIWLGALPFGLYQTCGLATIPIAMVVAFLLLGIDEIGVQIEEPLGLLPLDTMCDEIEGDLFSMLQEGAEVKRTAQMSTAAGAGSYTPLLSYGSEDDDAADGEHREWLESAIKPRPISDWFAEK